MFTHPRARKRPVIPSKCPPYISAKACWASDPTLRSTAPEIDTRLHWVGADRLQTITRKVGFGNAAIEGHFTFHRIDVDASYYP